MSPSLGNPYMRCGATDGLIVLAPSCSALRGSRSRAIRFPSQAQVGPVAKLHWLDRQKSRGFVRELPHDRNLQKQVFRRGIARSMDGFDAAGARGGVYEIKLAGSGRAAEDQSPGVPV